MWIHGGSFRSETGSDLRFDGSVLSSYGDVIVVSINFRLGVMGYISLDIPGEAPGKYNSSIVFVVLSPITARNLYQLNANEIPLTLNYGFEGHIYSLQDLMRAGSEFKGPILDATPFS